MSEQNDSAQESPVRSDWFCEIVRIGKIEKHPGADTLSITNVLGGYPCIFKTGELKEGDLATYISVDSLVPVAHDHFKFLDAGKGRTHERVKAKKLRGIFSMGLLVPALDFYREGDSVVDYYGIHKYEPPSQREPRVAFKTMKSRLSETAAFERVAYGIAAILAILTSGMIPPHFIPCGLLWFLPVWPIIRYNRSLHKRPNIPYYDVPSMRRYGDLLQEGEDVVLTEKIHGSQAAYCHTGKRFHMKSRTVFRGGHSDTKSPFGFNFDDVWTGIAKKYDLEEKLKAKPNMIVFGEIFGDKIQKAPYNYGLVGGFTSFVVFDVMDLNTRKFLDWEMFVSFCRELKLEHVPVLYVGPWSKDLSKLASGSSKLNSSVPREGWVCKPALEKHDNRIGRLILKMVSEEYLLIQGKQPDESQQQPEAAQ